MTGWSSPGPVAQDDLDALICGTGGTAEDVEEFVHAEEAGAGACGEQSAGADASHGEFVEVEIFSATFEEILAGGDELGGV